MLIANLLLALFFTNTYTCFIVVAVKPEYTYTYIHVFPGEHDRLGEKPRHPEAFWPKGEWALRPGD